MLHVRNLSIHFTRYALGLRKQEVRAIRCLDLDLAAGEVVAVVGQSGAGKSLLAHALLGILPSNARIEGEMIFRDEPLTPERMARLRGREIALVPQAVTYLNPLLRVGAQIARAARLSGLTRARAVEAAREALARYHLAREVGAWFPFQLSGGMVRRVLTATATVGLADLVLADEPTNGLDRETAAESLKHLRELADAGKAVLLITHDVGAALEVADRVAVFCGGVTVEVAWAGDFKRTGLLRHPYTRALWAALPANGFSLPGPSAHVIRLEGGCPYVSGCLSHGPACDAGLPDLLPADRGLVRCRHA
ncbi:MAG: ABC transporter ATP-binding protein [Proteobacteria bacterium]|nr:ABC transporter ATP-binding protein [Pseudomonadota bacterium]